MAIWTAGDFLPLNPNTTSGTDLATRLDRLVAALNSNNSNSSRPIYLTAGGVWSKSVANGYEVMLYDGTNDHKIAQVINNVLTVTSDGSIVAPAFSATATYKAGDIIWDAAAGGYKKVNNDIAAGAFNPGNWTVIPNLANELKLKIALAPPHSATERYEVGDVIVDATGNALLESKANIAPGAFSAANWQTKGHVTDFKQAGTGAVMRSVYSKLNETVSVKDFGAVGDGVVDDTAALQAARDYLASLSISGIELPTLLFPAGIYKYSLSPNWALNKINLQTVGEVRMRYTGVGNAFIIDGGTASVTMYSLTFSRFIIEAPSTAGHGVYIRNIHHSTFDFQVQGAGSASSGIYVAFSVCSVFYSPKVSVNDGGWYLGAKPNMGIFLTNAVVGIDAGFTSYCTFVNPIIEGTTQGIQVHRGLGNTFIGGTSEGITDTAIIIHDTSIRNKFFTIDMEGNLGDVLCNGQENEFYGIDSNGIFQFGPTSKQNLIVGGNFETISISSGAEDNTLTGVRYNIAGAGNLDNSGTRTRLRDLYNVQTDLHHNTVPTEIVSVPGPSPYTFTNTTGNDMTISITGGTVSYIGVIRNGASNGVGFSNGQVYLSANDGLEIVYTVAPTLITLNR